MIFIPLLLNQMRDNPAVVIPPHSIIRGKLLHV